MTPDLLGTAIQGSPKFTPLAVLCREMFVRLPPRIADDPDRHPNSGEPVTRGMANYLLEEAMSHFEDRPEQDDLNAVLDETAQRHGHRFPMRR